MTRFEILQQSLRLHLTVAERAARLLNDAAVKDPSVLDGVRYAESDGFNLPAASFDTRLILNAVLTARERVESLQVETRHEEPSSPDARPPAAEGPAAA